jgi:hypothetical protein
VKVVIPTKIRRGQWSGGDLHLLLTHFAHIPVFWVERLTPDGNRFCARNYSAGSITDKLLSSNDSTAFPC